MEVPILWILRGKIDSGWCAPHSWLGLGDMENVINSVRGWQLELLSHGAHTLEDRKWPWNWGLVFHSPRWNSEKLCILIRITTSWPITIPLIFMVLGLEILTTEFRESSATSNSAAAWSLSSSFISLSASSSTSSTSSCLFLHWWLTKNFHPPVADAPIHAVL